MEESMIRYLALALTWSLVGCGDPDSKDSDRAPAGPPGRGTPACHEWQGAICGWLSRCGGSAEQVSTCRDQAAGITCISDEEANRCSVVLAANPCTQAPVGCNIRDLADPQPGLEACSQYVDAVCSAADRCGQPKQECLAEPEIQAVCDGIIGHKPAFEQCITALSSWSCVATELPPVCNDVLLK
jgi:hypothetical protein